MKARMMVENPDDVVVTLKVTMTIKEMTALRDQMASSWPSWQFSAALTDCISQARKVFYAEDKEVGQ